ncbi:hypothetical protein [Rhizobium sp. S163]|uniref:hypothetical protein n=1 Tax=Rhizobium sp. S163 TaxID=3055039 RepID=UPI0025A9BFCB|nr:hypothetical protein [Rhizobium sp. S163]MDM9645594.1 hypothetical protein [Rhizobium sp. S163]
MDREENIERELGRKKLMMRLPTLRDQLRHASGAQIEALFVAYERAAAHQERIRAQKSAPAQWTAYYDKVFAELEESVRLYLTGQRWQDFS